MKSNTLSALTTAALASSTALATVTGPLAPRASSNLTSVTITGNAFYAGDTRFYIRGVDYQPGGSSANSDPLADSAGCTRDVPEFTKLGINTIRVYTVDNTANHDDCMSALSAAGIYLILDTDNSQYSLNRDDPAKSYNSVYLQSVFATIDAFEGYSNTLAFLSGNEVVNAANNTNCAPYVKAVTRDMKNYITARGYRQIPVGYSAADVDAIQEVMAEYLNCGSDDVRSDFYAINDYSWCDPSSFTTSGWDTLVANYTGYGIPLFMSEYGCIANTRTFQEVAALYNTEMTGVFSGGLVYEYSEEGNGYGLVTISGNSVTEEADFNNLVTAYANTSNPSGSGGASSTSSASTCPPSSANWDVTNDALPEMPAAASKFLQDGAGPGPGLTGDGSQNSGNSSTDSTAMATTESAVPTATSTSGTSTSKPKKSMSVSQWQTDVSTYWLSMIVLIGTIVGMTLL